MNSASRFPSIALLLFVHGVAWCESPSGEIPAKLAYHHTGSGLSFAAKIGDWEFQGIRRSDGDRNIGILYATRESEAKLSIFVYPAPVDTIGPTFRLDDRGRRILDSSPEPDES